MAETNLDVVGAEVVPMRAIEATAYASAARTATPTAVQYESQGRRGVRCVLDVTAVGVTPSVVVTIEGYDPASGKWFVLLTSAAKTGIGTTVLVVYPTIVAAANLAVNDVLPPVFRVVVTHGNATSITYSLGMALLP